MLGDDTGPFPDYTDPGATGSHVRRPCRVEELLPRTDRLGRREIGVEARPVVVIVAAQQLDPTLLGDRASRLRRIEDKQRSGPPADLVVGEIADPVGSVAVGGNELASERVYPGLGLGRKRVEPMKAREPPELEVDDGGKFERLRGQRPAARAIKAPRKQPAAGLGGPICERRRKRCPVITGITLSDLLVLEFAAIEHVDAKAEKALAA